MAINYNKDLIIDTIDGKVDIVDLNIDTIKAIIGTLTDDIVVPYTFGINTILAHLNASYYHIHGRSFTRPHHANSVTITSGAGIWALSGTKTEVIAPGSLSATNFDLHWINIYNISGNGELQVDIYSGGVGDEVLIGSTKANRNAVQSQEGAKRVQIPQQPVNTRISCKLSDSTAGTLSCDVSFEGHYYAS